MGRPASSDLPLHIALGLSSAAATWLSTGIFFITEKVLGWGVLANLALSAVEGTVYVCGALLAARSSARWGRKPLLIGLYILLALLTACLAFVKTPIPFVVLLTMWTFLAAMNWPAVEALLCYGDTPESVSRRVGLYNIIWASTGALAIASVSWFLAVSPVLLFLAAAAMHGTSCLLVYLSGPERAVAHAHVEAPPELLARRTLAKQLSRLSLPASYTIIYALTPLLASMPVVKELPEQSRSAATSVWLVARVAVFVAMTMTAFWHARPGLLMGAVLTMAAAFAAAIIGLPSQPFAGQLAWLVLAQAVLGGAMGVIYFASLYFGMVLSHGGEGEGGSTEQGGYHEALIGAGTVLGPGMGAAAMVMSFHPAAGVGAVVTVSAAACAAVAVSRR